MTDSITIQVTQGRSLIPCNKSGTSDPYCVITIGNETKKTKKIRDTLNPTWNETLVFSINSTSQNNDIHIEVFDWNRIKKHKRMGQVRIHIKDLESELDKWLTLESTKGEDVSGEIHVVINYKRAARTTTQTRLEIDESPLFKAVKASDLEAVNKLLAEGADVNQMDKYQYTPLHSAACLFSENDDQIVSVLLEQKGINVNLENEDKNTPLHYFAAKFRSPTCTEIFEKFIQKGANVNCQNSLGETPLHKAIFNNSVRILMVDLLLKAGADVNKPNQKGETPLHYAVRLGREDLLSALLKGGADVAVKADIHLKGKQSHLTPYELALEEERDRIAYLLKRVQDLYDWLDEIEMEKYRKTFVEQDMYLDLIPDIDEKTLDHMGITKTGHRLKILKAARTLKEARGSQPKKEEENTAAISNVKSFEIKAINLEEELNRMKYVNKSSSWMIETSSLEFTTKIGSGTSGTVYKGIFEGETVAIKLLKTNQTQKELEEFKKEFHIMASIRSPYIVFFFGACLKPKMCMVMEMMSRGSLYHVLNDPQLDLGWDKVFSFSKEALKGIDCLHSWNPQVVHRDLKSLNLMVNEQMHVKVGDFGLSRFNTETQGQTLNKMVGTMAYCAPEVYFGEKFSTASDVFSVAIILWELVTRCIKGKYERPYQEHPHLRFDFQIIIQVAKKELRPTLPETTPEPFSELIKLCWSHNEKNRPSCKEIIAKLDEFETDFGNNKEKWNSSIKLE